MSGSSQYNSVVNDRLTGASESTEISNQVIELLDCLEGIDEKLKKAQCRLAAKSVDKITMNADEIRWLRSERRRVIRELSDLLDVPIEKSSGRNVAVLV